MASKGATMKFIPTCALTILLLWSHPIEVISAEADSARAWYRQYCSSCHGADGGGKGPVTPYLSVKVPDLTLLKKKNNGTYPLDRVMSVIDGRRIVRAHGDREMPVWGEVFKKEQDRYPELTTLLKAKMIAEYVGTLQR
jgi:mono/diheme cytochrome c family protein